MPPNETKPGNHQPCQEHGLDEPDPLTSASSRLRSGILAADKAVFTAMESGIPNIAPKGTRAGDFSSVTYNNTDPDCWWSWNKCTTPKLAGLADDTTECPEANTWGLTLDDGPNCSHNAYYDYLLEQEQKATMFFIGSNVMDWPLEAQRTLGDGHEICVHSKQTSPCPPPPGRPRARGANSPLSLTRAAWSHPYMTALTNEQVFAELYFTKKAIHDITGVSVQCWRPPYGDIDDRVRFIATKLGLRTIGWDQDTNDWEHAELGIATVEANYNAIINKVANGSYATHGTIVLTHEIDNETMTLSEQFLPTIVEKFTGGVMPVGVCHNWTQPYGEGSEYVYPNYAQWVAGTHSISLAQPTAYSSEIPFATAAVVTSAGASGAAASATAAASGSGSSTKKASQATASASSAGASSAASPVATSSSTSAAVAAQAGGLMAVLAMVGAAVVAF